MKETISIADVIALVPEFSEYADTPFNDGADLSSLESELDTGTYIGWSAVFNERMKVMPINEWVCTDTPVGVHAYYFDGRFVALSFQSARKNDTNFQWVSKEDAQQVKNFIREISDDSSEIEVTVIDPTKEISSDWLDKKTNQYKYW